MSTNPAPADADVAPPWKTCLDIENQAGDHYYDNVNRSLLDLIDGTPRRVLELGCATGSCGQVLKERFPGLSVVGVDANRAAATAAQARLDKVICGRIEDIDFAAEGIAPREFDMVIAADILEHLVNPWRLLERLHQWLAPGAQLLASIPNVRNLRLLSEALQGGRWTYQTRGLLDVTHLRFFTLTEMYRMFHETGYALDKYGVVIGRSLNDLFLKYRDQPSATIQYGRITLSAVTPPELAELCAEQFLLRCRPASAPAA